MSPEQILSALGQQIAGDANIHVKLWYAALRQAGHDEADAKDLFQEMVFRALEDEATGEWSPGKELTGYQLCSQKLRNIAGDWRRGMRWRLARHVGEEEAEKAPTSSPNPDQALQLRDEHQAKRKLVDEVRAELRRLGPSGVIPLAMLDWADKGVHGHQELADKIGCKLEDIRKAQRRLSDAVLRVMERQGGRPS